MSSNPERARRACAAARGDLNVLRVSPVMVDADASASSAVLAAETTMDLSARVQMFEAHIQSYTGDDPLDPWDRYFRWVEGISEVEGRQYYLVHLLERLVKTFLSDKRYQHDRRFIDCCVKFANVTDNPSQFFDYMYSQDIGTKSSVLYVAWAQQLGMQGKMLHANTVIQKGIQNGAQPVEKLHQQYRLFQSYLSTSQTSNQVGVLQPLNPQLSNQMDPKDDPACALQNRNPSDSEPQPVIHGGQKHMKPPKYITTISKSEVLPASSSSAALEQKSMYDKSLLDCEGSELCFEEVRAKIYFKKAQQLKRHKEWEDEDREFMEQKENDLLELQKLQQKFDQLSQASFSSSQKTVVEASAHQSLLSTTVLSTTRCQSELVAPSPAGCLQTSLNVEGKHQSSAAGVSALHFAGELQQQLELASLSASMNKKEDSEVRLDLEECEKSLQRLEVSHKDSVQPPQKRATISHSYCHGKQNWDTFHQKLQHSTEMRDASGGQNTSIFIDNRQATPNSSGLMHTMASIVQPSPTVHTKEALGFIMGEFQAPSFKDTAMLSEEEEEQNEFEVYCRNQGPGEAASMTSAAPVVAPAFTIFEDENAGVTQPHPKPAEGKAFGERPTAGCAAKPEEESQPAECLTGDCTVWANHCNKTLAPSPNSTGEFSHAARLASTPFNFIQGHACHVTQDKVIENPWDDGLIRQLLLRAPKRISSYSNTFEWESNLPLLKPKAELVFEQTCANLAIQMFSGYNSHHPWLLAIVTEDDRNCSSTSGGPASTTFHIDCILGKGSFGQIYQASVLDMDNTRNNRKVILKVQKPANPWEFYIDAQLTERLNPNMRKLFIQLYSAHFFKNGSILVGELFGYGTLLDTINIYKTLTEKVMPQALVIYFTIKILYMVEALHKCGIIHGDVKPDNVMFGERFLDNDTHDIDDDSHGLAIIDFGQSIDMTLFPEGTVFTGKCETSGFQCPEMITHKPWNYQTDYFGIAATAYSMLFGTYMKMRNEEGIWKPDGVFRRVPNAEVWTDFFYTLLNIEDCNHQPSLGALRARLRDLLLSTYANKVKALCNRLAVLLVENKRSRK